MIRVVARPGTYRRKDARPAEERAIDAVFLQWIATPVDEATHFMVCNQCSQAFDMRDLTQVMYHETASHTPHETH